MLSKDLIYAGMDTTAVLEKYSQELSNLPLEVKYLMKEIASRDEQLLETRKKYQAKDNQIHKFIRANGTLTKHPKEQQLYGKIEEDMQLAQKLQEEKIVFANTSLFLLTKYMRDFDSDVAKLERDELLPVVNIDSEGEDSGSDDNSSTSGATDMLSGTGTPQEYPAGHGDGSSGVFKRVQKRRHGPNVRNADSFRNPKRRRSEDFEDFQDNDSRDARTSRGPNSGEDADNNLYCFCQRVSFGEMIGCDNDDCKYEWFHWSCVGITSPPKDDEVWYCPDCAPKMEKRKKKKK